MMLIVLILVVALGWAVMAASIVAQMQSLFELGVSIVLLALTARVFWGLGSKSDE